MFHNSFQLLHVANGYMVTLPTSLYISNDDVIRHQAKIMKDEILGTDNIMQNLVPPEQSSFQEKNIFIFKNIDSALAFIKEKIIG